MRELRLGASRRCKGGERGRFPAVSEAAAVSEATTLATKITSPSPVDESTGEVGGTHQKIKLQGQGEGGRK
jgi:hypothetical protein